jgi:hypothetical protein
MLTTILLAAHPGIPSSAVKSNQRGTVLFLKDLSAGERIIRLAAPDYNVIDFFTE